MQSHSATAVLVAALGCTACSDAGQVPPSAPPVVTAAETPTVVVELGSKSAAPLPGVGAGAQWVVEVLELLPPNGGSLRRVRYRWHIVLPDGTMVTTASAIGVETPSEDTIQEGMRTTFTYGQGKDAIWSAWRLNIADATHVACFVDGGRGAAPDPASSPR